VRSGGIPECNTRNVLLYLIPIPGNNRLLTIMHILIVDSSQIPVSTYGGTQRMVYWLGKELVRQGHKVTFLVEKGSECPFADVSVLNEEEPLNDQIPSDVNIVHAHFPVREALDAPFMVTIHGNGNPGNPFDINTVFVSRDHAIRHGSEQFVYNGLDFEDYGTPDLSNSREFLLFIGKPGIRYKNLKDAKKIVRRAGEKLAVMGGKRLSFNPHILYQGKVGGEEKNRLLQRSKGLIFPVRWHEPFGLAAIESLYFGSPVIGTPYGALPELITDGMGFLSNSRSELVEAVQNLSDYDRRTCHEYVRAHFSIRRTARDYLDLYERVINGQDLNPRRPVRLASKRSGLLPMAR